MRVLVCSLLMVIAAGLPGMASAQRLPALAVPLHYDLRLTPDLEAERFAGRAEIDVHVLSPTARVVLHGAGLEVASAAVVAGGVTQAARVTLDAAAETITLEVPEMLPVGAAELQIAYSGILNRELRGFYISEANDRKYAVTQLEATDARRMFPSFDEPVYKATFAVTAVIDADDTAISNGPVISTVPGPGAGEKTVRFAPTERMSTYLVALAVGDFACAGRDVGATPVRICSTPAGRGLTAFALDATDTLLTWMNGYFAIDYPFGKLDLVAIPDFAAGAMENTGAIFFRESLLLVAPDAALATRKRAAAVIAHELAHQWFGNLVTMRWWDDLWLNEGFATWLETKAVAAWQPDWNVEVDELQATHGAMSLDVLASTRAVRTAAETPAEIEELFDPIAYEKAAAILGMVESYVSEAAFRGGINAYLHHYRFDNAAAEDFWTVMTRAAGRPVDRIMHSFVEQPGVPLITVETACSQGNTQVTLAQERFTGGVRHQAEASDPLWTIPVCLETRGDGAADRCELMTARQASVTLPGCARWVMGNDGAEGYYRTKHGEAALERLAMSNAALAPDERLALVADEWALLRAGQRDVTAFMNLAAALAGEVRAPDVVDNLGGRLQFLHEYLTTAGTRPPFEAWVRDRFEPLLETTSRGSHPDEQLQRRLALTLTLVGAVGRDAKVLADARQRVERYLEAPGQVNIPATVLNALVPLAALTGDAALYEQYRARAEAATTPEERYRFLYALAAFQDPALLRRTVDLAMSSAVRAQDRAGLLGAVLDNSAGRAIAWELIQQRWDRLEQGLGAFGGVGRVVDALGAFCSPGAAEEVRAFFARHPVTGAERALAQTLEDINRCAAWRERQGPKLRLWLQTMQ